MQKLDSTDEPIRINAASLYKIYKKEGGKLSYRQYKDIIAEFNREIVKNILLGYRWEAPYWLGLFKVIENPRRIKVKENGAISGSVNWKESNLIKTEILARGGTPYREEKGGDGKKISDNGGEKWLVYHTESCYYLLVHVAHALLHNSLYYKFDYTWHNQRAMQAIIGEDSELIFDRANPKHKESKKNFLFKIFGNAYGIKVHESNFDLI